MESRNLHICITGAAGRIAYSLFDTLCSGYIFGKDVQLELNLLDLQSKRERLEGILLELEDGAYPLLQSVKITEKLEKAFENIDLAIFLGGELRKPGSNYKFSFNSFLGQERIDVLGQNVEIFKNQGLAMNKYARRDCRALVVTNPCNILCYVLRKYATSFPDQNFTCLTRLDQNRSISQIAKKVGCKTTDIKNVISWGNHNPTMFPDVYLGTIKGNKITDVITEKEWLKTKFIPTICKRGSQYLNRLKSSCVMSAAKAIGDHLKDWFIGTDRETMTSMGVISDGSYKIPKGVVSSMPIQCLGQFKIKIVKGLKLNSQQQQGILISVNDLKREIELINEYFEETWRDQEEESSSDMMF